MIYLTSDTHYGHANIIKFCHRQFSSVEEMNYKLVQNWNEVVGPNDDVWHLGDVALGSANVKQFVSQLNGRIHLVLGNHDYKNIVEQKLTHLFEEVVEAKSFKYGGFRIFLSHFPYLCWHGNFKHYFPQFHGHVHLIKGYNGLDLERMKLASPNQYDVGVDLNDFRPISIDEALAKVKSQMDKGKNCYYMWCV